MQMPTDAVHRHTRIAQPTVSGSYRGLNGCVGQ